MTSMRRLVVLGGLAWLVVAGYGLVTAAVDLEQWEVPYAVYNVALLTGVVLVLVAATRASQASPRPRLRLAGLVVCGIAGAASLAVAWAVAVWMTVLCAGLLIVTLASGPGERRAMVLLAGAQAAGLVVLFAGLLAEVGRRDEWGDHPVPGAVAIVVTAVVVILGLVELRRSEVPSAL
jgi:hypothetical protein